MIYQALTLPVPPPPPHLHLAFPWGVAPHLRARVLNGSKFIVVTSLAIMVEVGGSVSFFSYCYDIGIQNFKMLSLYHAALMTYICNPQLPSEYRQNARSSLLPTDDVT